MADVCCCPSSNGIKDRVNKPFSTSSFAFRMKTDFDNPILFMSFLDALVFVLAIMVVIEPGRLYSQPAPTELATFVKNIYDESLGVDELEDLKYYESLVQNGDDIGARLTGFQFSDSEIYEAFSKRRILNLSLGKCQ